ncbi:ORF12 [Pigeon adenovirus 2a]|nr:ORF12 [Pigeon adenovirus 2a]
MAVSTKRMRAKQPYEVVSFLHEHRLFSRKSWLTFDKSHYELYQHVAKELIYEAKKLYCSFALIQSLMQEFRTPLHRPYIRTPLEDGFKALCDSEGFNLTVMVNAIRMWMHAPLEDEFLLKTNTLYVVGDSTTDADAFTTYLLKYFDLIVTADLNQFDPFQYLPGRKVIKMLHFPLTTGLQSFNNPYVNTLLRGKEVNLPVKKNIKSMGPYKCVVRLRQVPKPNLLPTNSREHIIISFASGNPDTYFHPAELARYIQKLREVHVRAELVTCKNDFNCICSSNQLDIVCEVCRNCRIILTDDDDVSVTDTD